MGSPDTLAKRTAKFAGIVRTPKALTFDYAYGIQTEAATLLAEHDFEMASYEVLHLAKISHCSAYDCEFVALAKRLDLQLMTADKKILKAFPSIAISLAEAVA